MRRLRVLAALALFGCPSEPPGVDPSPYQDCTGACVVTFDVPRTCDASPPLGRAVAVAAEQRAAYDEALGSEVCRAPPYDDFFLESLFAPRCESGRCRLAPPDPDTGVPCQRTADCADGYRCLDVIGLPGPACVAVEEACTPPSVVPPFAPERPLTTDVDWRWDVPTGCTDGEARIGDAFACSRVGSPCAPDGWPADLPVLGVAYVDPAAPGPGQGTRFDPFPSVAAALASTATIAALHVGTHDVPTLDRPFALVGACASATIIRGAAVSAAGVELRDVRASGIVFVEANATLDVRDAILGATLFVGGAATVTRSLSSGADLVGVSSDGTITLDHVEVEDAESYGLLVSGGRAELRSVVVGGTYDVMVPADIVAIDAHLILVDVHLEPAGVGLSASDSIVEALHLAIEGGELGLSFGSTDAQLEDVSTSRTARAARVEGGNVEFTNLSAVAGRGGVDVVGGSGTTLVALERVWFEGQPDFGLRVVGGLARVFARDVRSEGIEGDVVRVGDGATVQIERAAFADIGSAAGFRVEAARAQIHDLTIVDVFRGLDASGGAQVEVTRAEVTDVGVAAFISRGVDTDVTLSDIRVTSGVGDLKGFFGRGLAVERAGAMHANRVHLERCREVAASASGLGTTLDLENLVVVDTRPRVCAEGTCRDRPLGVGVGAYYDAVASLTTFEVSADLICLQELARAQVLASAGRLQGCAIGQYLESSAPATGLCHEDVDARTNETAVEPPDIDLP